MYIYVNLIDYVDFDYDFDHVIVYLWLVGSCWLRPWQLLGRRTSLSGLGNLKFFFILCLLLIVVCFVRIFTFHNHETKASQPEVVVCLVELFCLSYFCISLLWSFVLLLWHCGWFYGWLWSPSISQFDGQHCCCYLCYDCLVFDGILDRRFTSNSQSMQGGEGGKGRVQGGRGRKEVHKRRLNLFLFGFA